MNRNKVYILGAGPGSAEFVTGKVRKAIQESGIIVGWELNFSSVSELLENKKIYFQDAGNYLQLAREAADEARMSGATVAVIRIGDPCISSGLNALLDIYHDFDIEIIPGISSVQIAAATARINLDESAVVSFHEDDEPLEAKNSFLLEAFRRKRHLIILTGQMQKPDETAKYLIGQGIGEDTLTIVGENLTLENETVSRGTLRDTARGKFSWLSVMVVRHGDRP